MGQKSLQRVSEDIKVEKEEEEVKYACSRTGGSVLAILRGNFHLFASNLNNTAFLSDMSMRVII